MAGVILLSWITGALGVVLCFSTASVSGLSSLKLVLVFIIVAHLSVQLNIGMNQQISFVDSTKTIYRRRRRCPDFYEACCCCCEPTPIEKPDIEMPKRDGRVGKGISCCIV